MRFWRAGGVATRCVFKMSDSRGRGPDRGQRKRRGPPRPSRPGRPWQPLQAHREVLSGFGVGITLASAHLKHSGAAGPKHVARRSPMAETTQLIRPTARLSRGNGDFRKLLRSAVRARLVPMAPERGKVHRGAICCRAAWAERAAQGSVQPAQPSWLRARGPCPGKTAAGCCGFRPAAPRPGIAHSPEPRADRKGPGRSDRSRWVQGGQPLGACGPRATGAPCGGLHRQA